MDAFILDVEFFYLDILSKGCTALDKEHRDEDWIWSIGMRIGFGYTFWIGI